MSRRLTTTLILLATSLAAQHSTTRTNPFNGPADVDEGDRMFRGTCAACHGPNGKGGAAGPDLTTGAFKRGDSDDAIFATISKGIPGTNMPAFNGSAKEVWQITAYVRSLSIGRANVAAKGNAASGAKLFASAGCVKCHSGAGAPDLSEVGARRSLAELQRSILDPNAEVSTDYWRLNARTKKGEQIGGIRTNEDTFSFQYRQGTRLRSVLKEDLQSHELVRTSAMPPYKGKLTAAELDDLVAWLAAQRGGNAR